MEILLYDYIIAGFISYWLSTMGFSQGAAEQVWMYVTYSTVPRDILE